MPRTGRIRSSPFGYKAELLAEAADVHIHAAVKGAERAAERGLGQLLAGYDHAGAAQEQLEHVELRAGQLDRQAVTYGGAGKQGEGDIAHGQGFVSGGLTVAAERAAQHGPDAGDKFAGIEGFGNIVVGADFEAEDAVHRFAAGGEQDHGNPGVGAQGLEQFESGATGQHDIEDDDVVVAAESGLEAGAMIEDGGDLEALVVQKALQQGDQFLVVVHDEYAAHGHPFCVTDGPAAVKNCYELAWIRSQKFTFLHRVFTPRLDRGSSC